jgi:hypothetical protein
VRRVTLITILVLVALIVAAGVFVGLDLAGGG